MGEITTSTYVDIPSLVRSVVRDIGYTRAKFGFDADTCGVIVSIKEQSPTLRWASTRRWKPSRARYPMSRSRPSAQAIKV